MILGTATWQVFTIMSFGEQLIIFKNKYYRCIEIAGLFCHVGCCGTLVVTNMCSEIGY